MIVNERHFSPTFESSTKLWWKEGSFVHKASNLRGVPLQFIRGAIVDDSLIEREGKLNELALPATIFFLKFK